jgi:orotate phosphoribosyltransferase
MYNKQRLLDLIRENALSRGEFRLSSGGISTYYVDLSKVVMLCEGLQQIVWGLCDLEEIMWDEFDSIGGPAVGAIPIISSMMLETGIERSFFVRSEPKEHGKYDLIEGNLRAGDNVLMLEDVTTTGESLLRSIKAVEEKGGVIKRIYAVMDRGAGARECLKDYNFISLLNVAEILE